MSRFYLSGNNSRGNTVTAAGSKKSGQHCHIRGWNSGIYVEAHVDEDGNDVFTICTTGGSRSSRPSRFIGTLKDGWLDLVDAAPRPCKECGSVDLTEGKDGNL